MFWVRYCFYASTQFLVPKTVLKRTVTFHYVMSESIKNNDAVKERNTAHPCLSQSSNSLSIHADRRKEYTAHAYRTRHASPVEAGVEIELTNVSTQPVDSTVYENPFDCDYGFLALPIDKNLVHPYS